MINVIVELSKYVILTLMVIYVSGRVVLCRNDGIFCGNPDFVQDFL